MVGSLQGRYKTKEKETVWDSLIRFLTCIWLYYMPFEFPAPIQRNATVYNLHIYITKKEKEISMVLYLPSSLNPCQFCS